MYKRYINSIIIIIIIIINFLEAVNTLVFYSMSTGINCLPVRTDSE